MYIVIGVKANDNIWPFQMDERERESRSSYYYSSIKLFFGNSISIEYYFEQVHHKIPMDNS